jgi:hypothetical protein
MGVDKERKTSSMVASIAESALSGCAPNCVLIVTILEGGSSLEWGCANREVERQTPENVNRAAKKTIPATHMNSERCGMWGISESQMLKTDMWSSRRDGVTNPATNHSISANSPEKRKEVNSANETDVVVCISMGLLGGKRYVVPVDTWRLRR